MWLLFVILSRVGIFAVDSILSQALSTAQRLPTKPYRMTPTDRLCLAINSVVVENVFLWWVLRATWHVPIPGALRVLVHSLYLLLVDDAVYTVFHRMLHKNKWLYTCVHERHHRIRYPEGGYVHASMEHPLEMAGALVIHSLVIRSIRADLLSVSLHLLLKAMASCINHSGKRCRILCYDSADHARHHAKGVVELHQMIPFGRLFGQ